jgi:CRP/FNR family transcriptional regulator
LHAFDTHGWDVKYIGDSHVIWEGEACEHVYGVLSGRIEIYRTATDGREHSLRIIDPGDIFNLVPALKDGGKNRANARCLSHSELVVMSADDLRKILDQYPEFSQKVLRLVSDRLNTMIEISGALALHTVEQRTAAFLVREANRSAEANKKPWTQDEMARQIGTVRDVIGRTLRKFEEKGLIKRDRGNITLIDRTGLERLSAGDNAT